MVDYLGDKRTLPKVKSASNEERLIDVQCKKCKTCANYSFYFCQKLQTRCGPECICLDIARYTQRADYILS